MTTYKDLIVWQKAIELVLKTYEVTEKFPKEEIYGITNQMRRCVVSVPSNIAEGCGRQTSKDTIHFLYISRGSLYELETQWYLVLDQKFINENDFQNVMIQIEICKKLLNGFINYYKKL